MKKNIEILKNNLKKIIKKKYKKIFKRFMNKIKIFM